MSLRQVRHWGGRIILLNEVPTLAKNLQHIQEQINILTREVQHLKVKANNPLSCFKIKESNNDSSSLKSVKFVPWRKKAYCHA